MTGNDTAKEDTLIAAYGEFTRAFNAEYGRDSWKAFCKAMYFAFPKTAAPLHDLETDGTPFLDLYSSVNGLRGTLRDLYSKVERPPEQTTKTSPNAYEQIVFARGKCKELELPEPTRRPAWAGKVVKVTGP